MIKRLTAETLRPHRLILAFAAISLAFPAGAKTNYKKWLQEDVIWIISQKERDRFLTLKTDAEKEAFIQEFWERRDPTPSTPRNEYKEEHYRRFDYALKHFQEGIAGWRTDRGRVFIIHGRPDREYFISSQARLDLGPMSDGQSRMPNTIIWSYFENPNGKYYSGELNLIFQPSAGLTKQNFALDDSPTAQQRAEDLARLFGPAADQNWMEGDMRYNLVTAGPPAMVNSRGAEMPTTGISEAAKYIADVFRSPGDVLEERLEKQQQLNKAKLQIREDVAAHLSFGSLPISLSNRSFVQPDGNYLLLAQIDVPNASLAEDLANLKKESDTFRLDIYCGLLDSADRVADEFVDSTEVSRSMLSAQPNAHIHYLNAFTVPPGRYTFKAAVRSADGKRLGFKEQEVATTPEGRSGVWLSEVLLTNRVQAVRGERPALSGPWVTLGGARLVPHPAGQFLPSDSLFLYFQAYLPEGEKLKDIDLSVAISFLKDGAVYSRLEPRKISDRQSTLPGVVNYATAVPLNGFAPGEYILQVQVIDHTSKKFAFQRSAFTVLDH
jgi:GWxTD domain-containing protein